MAVFESKGAWDYNTVREWLQVVKRGQKEVTLAKYSRFVPRRVVNSRNETVSASSKAGRCLSESDARVSVFPLSKKLAHLVRGHAAERSTRSIPEINLHDLSLDFEAVAKWIQRRYD